MGTWPQVCTLATGKVQIHTNSALESTFVLIIRKQERIQGGWGEGSWGSGKTS